MPDTYNRHEASAKGPWFVDMGLCEGCRECVSCAPQNIQFDDKDGKAYVFKKPTAEKEEMACQKALEQCPQLAVGKEDEKKRLPPRARH